MENVVSASWWPVLHQFVEIGHSAHWNVEIQYQLLCKLPTVAAAAAAVKDIWPYIKCDIDSLSCIRLNNSLNLVLYCEEKAWTWKNVSAKYVYFYSCRR